MTNARSDARRRRLLLHVGLPKTGTSALQRWLHQNPARLEAAGICYPGAPYLNGDKHQFLVSELRHGGQSLERLLSSTTHDTVLLSSEGLSNHFHDFSEQALQRFRQLTADFRVEIVLVTREKTRWLASYHKQCVVNPGNGASELWATSLTCEQLADHPRVRRLMDTPRLTADLLSGFGGEQLHLIHFERNWFGSILALLPLAAGELPPLPRVNESIPDWSVELLRVLNALDAEPKRKTWWKRQLADFMNANHLELRVADPGAVSKTALLADLAGLQASLRRQKADVMDAKSYKKARGFLAAASATLADPDLR